MGVADQDEPFDREKIRTGTGFAAAIGGLTTVRHTGKAPIRAGDYVRYTMPNPQDVTDFRERNGFNDISAHKIVAGLEPALELSPKQMAVQILKHVRARVDAPHPVFPCADGALLGAQRP